MKTLHWMIANTALSMAVLSGANAGNAPSATVRFSDLDLTTAATSATLDQRVFRAARSVCQDRDPREWIFSHVKPTQAQYQLCLDQAILGATLKINRPLFTHFVGTQMAIPASLTRVQLAAK